MKTIKLEFKGYRREINKASLEDRAGIYCVYAGTYDPKTDSVTPQQLLYIGETTSIQERIGGDDHEHLEDWKNALDFGQILMYTRAFVSDEDDRIRAEAALIYHCQPPINDSGKDGFHHLDTEMLITGKHDFIDSNFIAYNTDD